MKKLFFIFVAVLFLASCSNSSSGGENCFTPPAPIYFKFVDSATGENLIANGTLKASNFSLKDQDGKVADFKVITENNLNAVVANIGWYNGVKNYHFDLGSSKSFDFKVTSHELTGSCGGYSVDNVEIISVDYTMDTYFYLIKL